MDWDVHHGNGTQAAFYQDPTVLYISTHQFPYYPGTGATEETGEGQGEGYTINIPLPAGCGDEEYLRVFKDVVIPCADRYEPEWILVSAGFDPHRRDPLGGMEVTEKGFAIMASSLLDAASKHASNKIAFLLEGGYDLMALKRSVSSVLEECAGHGKSEIPTKTGGKQIEPLIRTVLNIRDKYR
jgi:acetoin utilization deacetylase AcuC-like enzyme